MKVIALPRRGGKTTELIKLAAAKEGVYIVCSSHRDCVQIAEQAERMGLNILFPITFAEFLGGHYRSINIKAFLIDNVDLFLQGLTSVHIAAVTITDDEPAMIGMTHPVVRES